MRSQYSVYWKYQKFPDLGDSRYWKYCKFQDLGAPKDCKVLSGHASARQKVRGREGGREVEARVMQEKSSGNSFFMQVQILAITELLFYAVAISEIFRINFA